MEAAMAKLHELQERRSTAVSEMRAINDKAESEKRDYSDAENDKHKKLKTEVAGLDRQIERARDLAEAERAAPAVVHHGRGDGQFETRAREFSLLKAINARLGENVDDGFEREISAEVRARSGRSFQGIAVPDQYFHGEQRTLLVGSSAAPLYPTQHRDDLFIDKLRASLIVGRLGATVLNDLVGAQDIPRQTGSSTAQWLAEDGALTETDATFDDVTLTPKTVGAVTSYSRRTLINALPSIEEIVRADLTAVIAEAIDYQALFGSGSGNFPRGVVNAVGVIAETLSAPPTLAQLLEFPADIQVANADVGSMGWAMAADAQKKLRGSVKVASTDSAMLMEAPDSLLGYPVATSTIMTMSDTATSSIVIFGAWSQLLVGFWSGTDILINPFESVAYMRGRVLMRVMRDVDVAVRHGQSFAWAAMAV
jgi:HK97 family phage major capsid protein